MLSLLTCKATDDESVFDFDYDPYESKLRRKINALKRAGIKKRRRVTVGAPTGFQHHTHLGHEVHLDGTYVFWDADRWREELAKRDLILPPLATTPAPSQSTLQSTPSKRNSITPQRRKPVPTLHPESMEPHEVPLPPSPMIKPREEALAGVADYFELDCDEPAAALSESGWSSVLTPTLEPPSRGVSFDESIEETDELGLPETPTDGTDERPFRNAERFSHKQRQDIPIDAPLALGV